MLCRMCSLSGVRPWSTALFGCALLLASQPQARQQIAARGPQPAERAADLLTVTFAAVGTSDVTDLRADEVTVRIDGRARPVRSLQRVTVAEPGLPAASLPPPFGANSTSTSGRTVALILDDESFPPGGEQALRTAADRLFEGLSRSDRVSLVTIPHGGVRLAATTDHARIRTALATLVGRGAAAPSGSDLACRTRDSLQALTAQLAAMPPSEAPAIVVFLTAGLAPPRRDANIMAAPGRCELLLDTFREVGAAAGRVRAQFYLVPPVAIMSAGSVQRENIAGVGATGSDNPNEGIEQLMAVTGGRLVNLGGGNETAFDRILAEGAGYYLAAIEPHRSDRGRSHALDVAVTRRGLEIHAARAITFVEPPRGARPSAPSLRDMLSTTAVFRDLPLRASAYPSFEDTGGRVRVVALAEPVEPAVKFASLMAVLFDRDGKGIASWVADAADLDRAPAVGALAAPPGFYRLRVAAIDSTGRSGTADYDVDVSLAQTGTMKISGVLLGLSRQGGFVPRLQFVNEPVAIGYVELSGAAPGSKVTATLELADAPNAAARISVPLTIEAGASGRYVARGALPIGALPPGDYSVRAIVALDNHPPTRVIRTLRKAIPAK